MKTAVVLKERGTEALLRHHPWVYSGAVDKVRGNPKAGDTVDVLGPKGNWLARGAYSPTSILRVRVWTFDPQEMVDAAFFRKRIQEAAAYRNSLYPDGSVTGMRLVCAEADGLPGLIVDRYDSVAVCQFQSAGVEFWRQDIAAALAELPGIETVFERSDALVRKKEGLEMRTGTLLGPEPPEYVVIREGELLYRVDVRTGHKTGFYLDQRENRALVMAHAKDKAVLNAFSFTGGFGIAALKGGASEVVNIDTSGAALAVTLDNAVENRCDTSRMENIDGNAFNVLRSFRDRGRKFDVVVLDPPKFAESRQQVKKAARGYKDINRVGMGLLKPGGLLFTYSCSGAITGDLFQKIVADAALDAKRRGRIVRKLQQGPDHPVSLNFPEGMYLKGLMVRMD